MAGFGGIETDRLKWRGRTGAPKRSCGKPTPLAAGLGAGTVAVRYGDSAIPARNHQHADATFFTKHAG